MEQLPYHHHHHHHPKYHEHLFVPPLPPQHRAPPSLRPHLPQPSSLPPYPVDLNSQTPAFFYGRRVLSPPPPPPPRSYADQPALNFEYTTESLHHYIGNYVDRSRYDPNFYFRNPKVDVIDKDRSRSHNNDYSPNMWRSHETYNHRNTDGYRRYASRGRFKENKQKFINSSLKKKPIQKKGALLRIQLANTTSKNTSNDIKDSTRGRQNDTCVISDHRIEESPVELDVSFKSNSLVAKPKAIATPSGCSLTYRVSDYAKLKLTEDLFNPNSYPERNDPPSSINIGSASGCSSHVFSRGSVEMVGNAAPPLSPNVKAVGSDVNSGCSTSSQRIKRKRKRKRRIIAAPTLESFPQSVEDPDILSKSEVDNSQVEESNHLEPNDVSSDVISENHISKSPLNNVSVNIEFKSLGAMILEKGEASFGFTRPYAPSCYVKTGDSAVSSISAGTTYGDSSAFCSQAETITKEVPVQVCRSNKKYASTILPWECRPVHCSFEKLFDSSKHSSQSESQSLQNAHTRGSPEVEVSVKGYTESSQPGTTEMESPMHDACQPADINDCSNTCDFGCTGTCTDPKCDRKDEDITLDYSIFSVAGFNEVSVSRTTLLPGNKPCENIPDICGSRDTSTACGENGDVWSSGLSCNNSIERNKSISLLQDDLESDSPPKIVDQLAAPFQKGVGREDAETILSVHSLEVYSATSVRKRKSSVGDLLETTGSCVGIETATNCFLNNVSCAKESVNLDKNNSTSSGAYLAGDPVGVSLPDLLDDANEVSSRHGKKSKINQGNNICDTSLADADESAFANIPSLPVSSGSLIQDITSGASFKAVASNNGSFKECQEIDLLSSHPCANPEDSSAVSKTKNQLYNMAIVSDGNMEAPTNMVDLTDASMPVAINLESFSPRPPCFPNTAFTSNSVDAVMSTSKNDQSPVCLENLSVSDMEDYTTSGSHSSCRMVHQNDKTLNFEILHVSDFEVDKIVDGKAAGSPQIGYKMNGLTLPHGTGNVNCSTDSGGDRLITEGPRVYRSVPFRSNIASRKAGSLNHIARPRTWHRANSISNSTITDLVTHSIVPQQSYNQKIVAGVHNTYVRKGNSLVRKSSPACNTSKGVYASTVNGVSSCVDNVDKVMELDPRECHTNTNTSSATGRHNTTVKRPKLPSICYGSGMLNSSARTSNGDAFLPGLDLSANVDPVTSLNLLNLTADMENVNSKNAVKPSGALIYQTGSMQNIEGKSIMVEKDQGQAITYVKHRRNRLVAAMETGGTAVPCGRKKRELSPNGYYKRRKNQLVRTSPKNHVAKCIAAANGSQNEEGEQVKLSTNGKGNLLNSSIWRSYDTKSSKPDANSVCSFRAWYHFPWKRATYLRHFMSTPNSSSLSKLSQKLLSRSKATVYTRSTDGFSLRRSKVLSVGGSNLKWSKSTERKLKKANEEVTLAVAAALESRIEQKMDPSAVMNRRNLASRKRIFRIGSQRYKMDPTKKTLHRITHEEDDLQLVPQADDNGGKFYVPRKLFLGNDEYVRIGNGNQLIRDPKRRTRSLASEKVRWSLHTARQRLAKKKKYCQFFTRFGQCNKDDGKCSYIHDPSKVAVCTKFLSGSCSNQNCNLTHEVIPERMPDCSYFLQGLCSNKSCPYRHVHVHPSSSVCEGFLKGYCASGNECRKKHTYVCPMFEAAGECPQGSKCKLHHPKKRNQMKKPLREPKKAHGRYFVPGHIETSECKLSKMLSERCNDDILYEDGRIADFISLTVNDGEVGRSVCLIDKQESDLDPPEAQVSDIEDLIRPIRLMSKLI